MFVLTSGEKLSNAVWWMITSTITSYLFYGIYNTVVVIISR